MKKVVYLIFALSLTLLLSGQPVATAQAPAEYRVIVNSANPTKELTRSQVSSFLLKKKPKWDHGPDAAPADLAGESAVRSAMSEEIHGRTVASVKNFWQRQIFSGRDVPPPEMPDDAKMVEFVRGKDGAIGYVSAAARVDGVKVLSVRGD